MEKAKNDNVIKMPETILAREKYKHWKELNERFLKGDRLTAEERDFYANYKLSSEYQTQLTLEELGLGVM